MAAVVVGGRPMRPTEVDLRWIASILYRNEAIERSVSQRVCWVIQRLGAWPFNKLGSEGVGLDTGRFILSGSFARPVVAHKGIHSRQALVR